MRRRPPIGQAGNYQAPVDTTGMDPTMKASLGLGRQGRERRPVGGVMPPAAKPPKKSEWQVMEERIQKRRGEVRGARILKRQTGS